MSSRKSKRNTTKKKAKASEASEEERSEQPVVVVEEHEKDEDQSEGSLSFGSQPSQKRSLSMGSQGVNPTSMQTATELMEDIKSSKKTRMPTLAQDWVGRYEEDEEESMLELCGVLLRAAGCQYEVTPDDLEASQADSGSSDLDDLVKRLNTEAASARYPFVVNTGDFKGFKDKFLTFWDKLVRQCSGSVLFDDYFLPGINNWLSTLSCLKLRPLRHVASAVSLQLGSSLIDAHAHLAKRVATTKRQITEARKKSKKRSKADPLGAQLEREAAHLRLLAGYIEEVFNYALVLRYRDVWAPIRVSCMDTLGDWIIKYPELIDSSVKYIGWLLNDKDPKVRIAATSTLSRLFRIDDLALQLDEFSDAFSARIVDLCWDVDVNVSMEGIALCGLMANSGKLEDEDLQRIFKLISDSEKRVREAAAQFIHDVYLATEDEDSTQSSRRTSGSGSKKKNKSAERGASEKLLLKLVDFVQRHTHESKSAAPTLQALLTARPLQDWSAMTNLMLEDAGDLSLEDQASLAQLMLSAIKRAHSAGAAKKKGAKKQMLAMSDHFASHIGQLCKRYKADVTVAQVLAQLPCFLEPGSFQSAQHRKQHKQMVAALQELFLSHSAPDVLQHCITSLASLARAQYAFAEQASAALESIRASLDEQLETHGAILEEEEEEPDEDARFAFKLCLVRLSKLAGQCDPQLHSGTYPVVKLALEQVVADVPWICDDGTAVSLVRLAVQDTMWHLRRAFSDPGGSAAGLDLKRDDVLYAMNKILNDSDNKSAVVREEAFNQTVDLIALFAHFLRSNEELSHLRYVAHESLQTGLITFFHQVMEMEEDDAEADSLRCKVVRGVYTCIKVRALPLRMLADLLIYYGEFPHSSVSKLLKQILQQHRRDLAAQDLGANEHKIVLQTLELAFFNFQDSDRFQADRDELHKVATSLASTYTVAATKKHKDLPMSLVLLVQEGIKLGCAQAPKGHVFLSECMIPFCKKAVHPAKILQFFEDQLVLVAENKHTQGGGHEEDDEAEEDDDDFADDLTKFHSALRKTADPEGFKTPAAKKTKKKKQAVTPNPRMQLEMESSSSVGSSSKASSVKSSRKNSATKASTQKKKKKAANPSDKRKRAASSSKGKEEEEEQAEASFSISVSEVEDLEPPPRRTRKSKTAKQLALAAAAPSIYASDDEDDHGEEGQDSSSSSSMVSGVFD